MRRPALLVLSALLGTALVTAAAVPVAQAEQSTGVITAAGEVELAIFTEPVSPHLAGESLRLSGHLVLPDEGGTEGVGLAVVRTVAVDGAVTTATLPDVDASLGDWQFHDTPPVGRVTWTVTFRGDANHAVTSATSVPVDVVAPAPAPEYALTVDAPAQGVVGTAQTVGGRLTDGGRAVAGEQVSVIRTDGGGTAPLGTVTTSATGAWSVVDVPVRSGTATYTAQFTPPGSVLRASGSTSVSPRPTSLALTATTGQGRAKGTASLLAQLGPTTSSRTLTITASTNGAPAVLVAQGETDAAGRLLASYPLPKGTTVFTARFAGDEGSAPATATTALRR